jgi:hypothetical protein
VLAAVVLACVGGSVAWAHSWYPMECCHNQDCFPADAVSTNSNGETIVTVGNLQIPVPPQFASRPSLDNRVHICFTMDASRKAIIRCLFLPGVSEHPLGRHHLALAPARRSAKTPSPKA